MAKVNFYLLASASIDARLAFVCRLTDTIYRRGHQIFLYTDDLAQAEKLDELLWIEKPDSFIPHSLHPTNNPRCKITIGFGDQRPENKDTLINLSAQVPNFYAEFPRVVEVISQAPEILADSRNRYRLYQSQNNEIIIHDLKKLHESDNG